MDEYLHSIIDIQTIWLKIFTFMLSYNDMEWGDI